MKVSFLFLIILLNLLSSVSGQIAGPGNCANALSSSNGHCELTGSFTDVDGFRTITDLISIDMSGTTITDIVSFAFEDCSSLTTVIFPSTLEDIGQQAFQNTILNISVTFPASLNSISYDAFKNSKLKSITFPTGSNLEYMYDGAFEGCKDLTSADLNNTKLTKIWNQFYGASSLVDIKFPSSLVSIEYDPLGQKDNKYCFFCGTSLTSVTIPSSVKKISRKAFFQIPSLTSIELNEGLEEIGDEVFSRSSIKELTIPSTVVKIRNNAFGFCSMLTHVTMLNPVNFEVSIWTDPALNPFAQQFYDPIGSPLFGESPTETFTIPTSVKSLGGKGYLFNFAFICDGISKCDCEKGHGCELSQQNTLLTASKCTPGSYKDVVDRNPCTKCPVGTYMQPNIMGSISSSDCIACPSLTTTATTGSTACFLATQAPTLNPIPIPTPIPTNVPTPIPTIQVQVTSFDKNDDVEDPVLRSISTAIVVLCSVSFVLISLNFALNFYNKFLPNNNVVNKIPTDEKELEVI